jgi:hypothetical protein
MPIPGKFEGQLNDIQVAASGFVTVLVTMKYANPDDLPRMRDTLWERLQAFAELVQATARDIG